jgi:hypothetical protein
MSWAAFEERLIGLLFFIVDRTVLGWKSTLLGLAGYVFFITDHYSLSGKPLMHDPAFWGATATFITLTFKSEQQR